MDMLITQLLSEGLDKTSIDAGEYIIKEGAPGAKVYVLVEGEIAIERGGSIIAVVSKSGSIFGEMSALLAKSASANVKAESNCTMIVIDDILTQIRQNPEVGIGIMKCLANRIEVMNAKSEDENWWSYLST